MHEERDRDNRHFGALDRPWREKRQGRVLRSAATKDPPGSVPGM
jgi:hypothetical protein